MSERRLVNLKDLSPRDVQGVFDNISSVELKGSLDTIFGPLIRKDGTSNQEWNIEKERRIRGVMAYDFIRSRISVDKVAKEWDNIVDNPESQEHKKYLESIVGVKLTTRNEFFKHLKYRLTAAIKVQEDHEWRRITPEETHDVLSIFEQELNRANSTLPDDQQINFNIRLKCESIPHPRKVVFGRVWWYEPEVPVPDKSRRLEDVEIPVEEEKLREFNERVMGELIPLLTDEGRLIDEAVANARKDKPGMTQVEEQKVREIKKHDLEMLKTQLMLISDPEAGVVATAINFVRNDRNNALWALESARDHLAKKMKKEVKDSKGEKFKEMDADIHEAGLRAMLMFSGREPAELARNAVANMRDGTVVFSPTLIDQTTCTAFAGSSKIMATAIGEESALRRHPKVIYEERGAVLVHIPNLRDLPVETGDHAIVDTYSNEPMVIVNPTEDDKINYSKLRGVTGLSRAAKLREASHEAETKADDQRGIQAIKVQLAGNVSRPEDVISVAEYGAKGIGLNRVEFFLGTWEKMPAPEQMEKMLYEYYLDICEMFRKHVPPGKVGYPIDTRGLDLGGDKIPHVIRHLFEGKDPMVYRGAKVLLDQRDLFTSQYKAVARASALYPELGFFVPLIREPDEIRQFRELMGESNQELVLRSPQLEFREDVRFGAMIETTDAALNVRNIIDAGISFYTVGTNDLTCDRLNLQPNQLITGYHDHDPSVLRLLRRIKENTPETFLLVDLEDGKIGNYSAVCGDMAGTITGAIILTGLGFRKLSMVAEALPGVRRVIRDAHIDTFERIANETLELATPDEVIKHVVDRMKEIEGVNITKAHYQK